MPPKQTKITMPKKDAPLNSGALSSANVTAKIPTSRLATNDNYAMEDNGFFTTSARHPGLRFPSYIYSEVMPEYTRHGLNFIASLITDETTLRKAYPEISDADVANIRVFRTILAGTVVFVRNTIQDYSNYNTAEHDVWLNDMQYAQFVYEALHMVEAVTPVAGNDVLDVNSPMLYVLLREVTLALAIRSIGINRCLNAVSYEGQIDGLALEAATGQQLASMADGMLQNALARAGELKKESQRLSTDNEINSEASLTTLMKSISFRGMPKYK